AARKSSHVAPCANSAAPPVTGACVIWTGAMNTTRDNHRLNMPTNYSGWRMEDGGWGDNCAMSSVIPLATGVDYADLHFVGYPGVIATVLLHGVEGVAIVDPGPSTSLP